MSLSFPKLDQVMFLLHVTVDALQVLPLPQCYKPGLAGLVMSMLHKGPEHRPDAGQIMQALQVVCWVEYLRPGI